MHQLTEDVQSRTNLTRNQFLIWMGQQLAPEVPLYNMCFTFAFDVSLDPSAFERAWREAVNDLDALRSVVDDVDGVPLQRYPTGFAAPFEYVDLSTADDPAVSGADWVRARVGRQFRLAEGMVDCALLKVGPQRCIWYLCLHHLITDGITMLAIYRRVSKAYGHFIGEPVPTSPAPARFADYARHEHAFRESPAYERAQAYWRSQAGSAMAGGPLAFFDHVPSRRGHRTSRVVFDGITMPRLRELAAMPGFRALSEDMAVSNLLLTLLVAYLHRMRGGAHEPDESRRITVGVPFHNRTSGWRDAAGLFMEIGAISIDVGAQDTFSTLHRKVSAAFSGAMRNAVPGISSADQNRTYEALVNYVNTPFPPFAGARPHITWEHSGYGDSGQALRVQIHDFDGAGRLCVLFDFNASDFSALQMDWAVQRFKRVCEAFMADPDMRVNGFGLGDPDEHERHVVAFNATSAPYPADRTIVQLFEAQVARTPESVAVECGGQAWTYAELNTRANLLAHRLMAEGVDRDQPVLVHMAHSREVVAAILAVLKAGGAYVPVDPAYPRGRIDHMLAELTRDSQTRPVALTEPNALDAINPTKARVTVLDGDDWAFGAPLPANPLPRAAPGDLAYILYTSGSTGNPKGVMIEHRSLVNYAWWGAQQYADQRLLTWPLFTSLSFDLTVTSLFVPLITGGRIVAYPERAGLRGMNIFDVIDDNQADILKCTPSHLSLVKQGLADRSDVKVRTFIVGGEDFKTDLARDIAGVMPHPITIFNEYGPTEATVGCMIHRFDAERDDAASVPIGTPAANTQIMVLDAHGNAVPTGVVGEMYIGGHGLARGYFNRPDLAAERFVRTAALPTSPVLYKTGDLARWLPNSRLEFLGRADHQVKVGGARIELAEVEARVLTHSGIRECVVAMTSPATGPEGERRYCARCGLASDFPGVDYDGSGVCNFCRSYEIYKDKAAAYFRSMSEFSALADTMKARRVANQAEHDCVVLFSGGKDSTYMLYQIAALGLRPLVFSLDNGYISAQAKANIQRVVTALGVDHVYGSTPEMKAIFADSLRRFANVCNGCFKTIYTLATRLARERRIGYIVTGLSRGQFFETRLTEDLFEAGDFDPSRFDETIIAARKAYHRRDDAVSRYLDVDVFRDESLFDDVQFIDFYRYCDVSLHELYAFLDAHAPWIRPSDTGRSTNCLINDAGIFTHKKLRGFHNYALPYSWDVRMGHKTREAALDELNDEIDETEVKRMLREVGFDHPGLHQAANESQLTCYFVADRPVTASALRDHLGAHLPDYMIPAHFVQIDAMPLTPNGKVDRQALPRPGHARPALDAAYVEPRNETERRIAGIWCEVLRLDRVGVHDNFFDLGGSSLPALQIISRTNREFDVTLSLPAFFANPTIAGLGMAVEDTVIAQIAGLSDEEVEHLLAQP